MNLVGGASFFPHYGPEWQDVVAERTTGRKKDNSNVRMEKVYCLADEDVCCVQGEKREMIIFRGAGVVAL